MKKTLEELSASVLRNLLIEEIGKFIAGLEYSSIEDLQEMKLQLRKIFDLLVKKEAEEIAPILWGKKSTQAAKDSPQPDPGIVQD